MYWYVLYSKPNKELFLFEQLCSRNIDVYCPFIVIKPKNPRCRKRKPYFPRYLFIQADLDKVGDSFLKWMPGAIGLVQFGGEYARVPDAVIGELKKSLININHSETYPHRRFKPGDAVEIRTKPFDQYRAIFDSYIPGRERVRVLLQLLNDHQIQVELSPQNIELFHKQTVPR